VPKNSSDSSIPRFTWWDHRGTAEWLEYEFIKPRNSSGVEVYWFDDTATLRRERVLGKDGGFAAGLDGFVGVFGIDFRP